MTTATPTAKTCTGCDQVKPLADYPRRSASRDGHWARCKVCVLVRRKAWYEANKEQVLARQKARYEANRDQNIAQKKAYHAERWANDPEYRERIRAQRKAATTRYYRLLASAKQEPYTRQAIFERDGWVCGICDQPINPGLVGQVHPDAPSIDHIVPLSRGGDDTPANVQASHFGCNAGKCDRVSDEDLEVAA